jgi:hypothetical protein
MNAQKPKKESGEERRRARRTVIQESFNLFLVLPESMGMVRIYMRDISRLGLSFRVDMELGLKQGQELRARVYLNPAFFLPVECKVARLTASEVGMEFTQPKTPAVHALGLLQDFFEAAEKAGVLVE